MAKHRSRPPIDFLQAAIEGLGRPSDEFVIPPIPQEPSDLWQIVVLGTLDTRQHTPMWYHLIGCLSDAELEAATKSYIVIGVPPVRNVQNAPQQGIPLQPGFSQFDAGPFAVIAVQDKLTIQTASGSHRTRILDVADVVLKKLNEIYVPAYGINRMLNVKLKAVTAKQFLAQRLAGADLALPQQDNSEGQIAFTSHHGNFDTTIQLMPSQFESRRLNIVHNRHHSMKPMKGYYDVGQEIKEYAENDWRSADEYGAQLAQCVTRVEEGK